MDLQNQQRIKDAAEKFGAENCVVVLGSSDAEGAEIYAETVTNGDPTFAGPLAGVPLGLPVYHIFDETIRAECDPAQWEEQISMMEMCIRDRFVVGADPFLDITSNNDAIFVGNKNAAADNLARTFGDILGHLLKHRKTTPGLFYSRA